MLLSIVLKIIFKRKKYLITFFSLVLTFSLILHYLTVFTVYQKSLLIFAVMNGFWFTVFSLILNLLIAILFSLYLTLLLFARTIIKDSLKDKIVSLPGVIGGVVGTGCPTCGAPFLGLLGLPLGLLTLPLKGLEIKIFQSGFFRISHFFNFPKLKKGATLPTTPKIKII